MLTELPAHRDLLWLLVVREIRVRYARAALGAAWAVFPPLVMMAVFSVMNFERLIDENSPFADIPYTLFAFVGLVPWAHFATSLTLATPSLVLSGPILKKSRFPHEVIPLARVFSTLLDFGVGVVVLMILLVGYGRPIGISALAVVPVFALQFVFTCGLALLLSAANMFFRDVNYILQMVIVLAMFATSVVYPVVVTDPLASTVLLLNPMSAYLDAYREALLLGHWPTFELLALGAVGAYVALVVGAWAFARSSPRFPEEV